MLYSEENQYGQIGIDKAVVGKIIEDIVAEFNGKVLISNHKGKLPNFASKKLPGQDAISNMEISMGEKGIDIRVFVILIFGTSIAKTTSMMIELIQQEVRNAIGIEPNSVAIVVTGMMSKYTAKRNIEVKGQAPAPEQTGQK